MLSVIRRFPVLSVFTVLGLTFVLAPSLAARVQDSADKTVFVSVLNGAGKPVTDLKTEYFAIAEDNVERKVTSAKLTTQPVSIELLVDTSQSTGTNGVKNGAQTQVNIIQDLRKALVGFVDDVVAANPANQVAVMEFGQASITEVKMTSKAVDLEKGINKLFPIPGADSVLSEAIIQASNDLAKIPNPRRFIMIFNIEPGQETSKVQIQILEDAVKKGHASIWAVSLRLGAADNSISATVLPVLASRTGGRREVIVGQSAIGDQLKQFWSEINAQYEVNYTRPSGSATQVRVGLRADGLKAFNNQYAPK